MTTAAALPRPAPAPARGTAAPSLSLRVERIDAVAPGIRGLTLRPAAAGTRLPSYAPGSHLVLHCGERRNAYSLTGSGHAPESYTLSVMHRPEGRGGSDFVHRLRPGDVVTAAPPRDAFAPVASARHHLMIAGGIGITPFLSHLRAARLWKRSASLLFAVRAGAPVPHRAELEDLCGPNLRLVSGREAMRTAAAEALADQPLGTHLYVCGPEAMIDTVTALAAEHGWPEARCHAERFGGVEAGGGTPFPVRLARSGRTLDVPAEASLLDALEAAGLCWPSLCRQGVCGECRMEGASGAVLHRDHYLSPAERAAGTVLMPCVSRCDGLLALDL